MSHAGIVEPVRSGVDVGVRLGLGKQEQDDVYTNADNIQRRMLETEIQANEDEDRKERREVSHGGHETTEYCSLYTVRFGVILSSDRPLGRENPHWMM